MGQLRGLQYNAVYRSISGYEEVLQRLAQNRRYGGCFNSWLYRYCNITPGKTVTLRMFINQRMRQWLCGGAIREHPTPRTAIHG